MRVKILRGTMADGRVMRAGAVEDISTRDAQLLIRMGKAVPADVQTADPAPEAREPQTEQTTEQAPARRGRPRKDTNEGEK